MRPRHWVLVALIAAVLVGTWAYLHSDPTIKPLQFQGYIEGEYTLIGPEDGGRIVRVSVKEGDHVVQDEGLFELESSLQTAQLEEAKARLREATARLQNLQAEQMRASEISVLGAKERKAVAALELSTKELHRKSELFLKRVVSQAEVDRGKATVDRDTAALAEVREQIRVAHLSARSEEIKAAEASVEAAAAMVEQAEIRFSKRHVSAPATGRVQEVYYRVGEVVSQSQPVVALLPPGSVKVRFFVPEPKLSTMQIGVPVQLSCDGCPNDMTGRVDFISSEAEFTPPVIFGPKERAKLVFRVEARPEGHAETLSPGQPVTVTPGTGQGGQ